MPAPGAVVQDAGQAWDGFRWFLPLPERIGTASAGATTVGPPEFAMTRPGLATPVSDDPCQRIHYVVGPDHDPNELMNESGGHRTTYGPGDRQGLAQLSGLPCV